MFVTVFINVSEYVEMFIRHEDRYLKYNAKKTHRHALNRCIAYRKQATWKSLDRSYKTNVRPVQVRTTPPLLLTSITLVRLVRFFKCSPQARLSQFFFIV